VTTLRLADAHQCLHTKDGALTMTALMLNPEQVYLQILNTLIRDQPDELIFGMDRYCKEGQGTTLKDCIAGFWIVMASASCAPFIIEYQDEPRIVKPIQWDNANWNQMLLLELRRFVAAPILAELRKKT